MNNLTDWIKEIEEMEKMAGFYRCHTDKAHGFYFDVYSNKAITMDGIELIDKDNNLLLLLADLKFSEDSETPQDLKKYV